MGGPLRLQSREILRDEGDATVEGEKGRKGGGGENQWRKKQREKKEEKKEQLQFEALVLCRDFRKGDPF